MWKRFEDKTPRLNVILAFILIVAALIISGVDLYDTEKVGDVLKSFAMILTFIGVTLFGGKIRN